jgi:hypothetical protein
MLFPCIPAAVALEFAPRARHLDTGPGIPASFPEFIRKPLKFNGIDTWQRKIKETYERFQ